MQRAAGVEAVGVRRDAAHRVHADRPADHLRVAPAEGIGPGLVEDQGLRERGLGELGRDPADGRGRDAGARGDRIGAVVRAEIALGQQMEHRPRLPAVGQRHLALQGGLRVGIGRRARTARRAGPRPAGRRRRRARTGRHRRRPGRSITSQGALV